MMVMTMTGKWIYFAKKKYSISSEGVVLSQRTQNEVTQFRDNNGYCWVFLIHKNKRKKFRIDKLVLHFFTGTDIDTPYPIKHLDGDNSNNSLNNILIEIPERLEKPSNHRNQKFSEDDVMDIVKLLREGYSSGLIAEKYKCSGKVIDNINKGLSWKYFTWPITESFPIRKKTKFHKKQGEDCNFSKLNEEKVRKIKKLLKQRHTSVEIAKRFKVSISTISKIKSGKNWAHVE